MRWDSFFSLGGPNGQTERTGTNDVLFGWSSAFITVDAGGHVPRTNMLLVRRGMR